MTSRSFASFFVLALFTGCSSDVDDLFAAGGGAGAGDTNGGGGNPSTGGSGGNPSNGGSGGNPSTGGSPNTGGAGGNPSVGGSGGEAPVCGDGTADPNEDCDGEDLAGVSCEDYGFSDPSGLACAACAFDPAGCSATCDGALVEEGELCDSADLDGATCQDFGFVNPAGLQCVACSTLDPSGCVAACGNGTTEPTEECDDSNTTSDDGCSATCQLEESSCDAATPVAVNAGTITLTGTTVNSDADLTTSDPDCGISAQGKNKVYALTVSGSGFLTAWLERAGTTFDSVLYLRTSCDNDATTALCADSSLIVGSQFAGGGELVSLQVTSGQTLYLVVDGAFAADEGNYDLRVDLSAGQNCNDPVPFNMFPGTAMKALGSTQNQTATAGGSCGGTTAEDVVYQLIRRGDSITNMNASLTDAGTSYDSLLHVRTTCNSFGSEVSCVDEGGTGGESTDLLFEMNNTRFVFVDGSSGAEGPYTLVIDPN